MERHIGTEDRAILYADREGGMAVKLGELVLNEKLITREQLDEALEHQKAEGTRLGEALVALGYLSEQDLAACLSKRLAVPFVDLEQREVDPAALELVPAAAARSHRVLPLSTSGVVLRIAIADPTNLPAMDDIKFMTGKNVEPFVAPQTKLQEAIERYYGPDPSLERSEDAAGAESTGSRAVKREGALADEDLAAFETLTELDLAAMAEAEAEPDTVRREVIGPNGFEGREGQSPVVKLISLLFVDCLRREASDILIEPHEEGGRVRYRVDGVLYDVLTLPARLRDPVAGRIKIMLGADMNRRRRPQGGIIHLSFRVDERLRDVDFAVSCIPTVWGESFHLKRVDRSAWIPLSDLGFETSSLDSIRLALDGQRGMILLTGERGSGVTTTFYSALAAVTNPSLNVMTLEPWVEVDLPGVNQVARFEEKEISTGASVTWLARHDADVIGVSDIRDPETWAATLTAAQDAVVVASIGGGGTASRLVRLRDAQDSKTVPRTFAAALRVVVAQRLVRRVCEACKTEDQVDTEFLTDLGYSPDDVAASAVYRGAGCDACGGVGYRGRVGLFETMVITPGIRDLLAAGADADRIEKMALEEGMVTLRRCGLDKVKRGLTTIEEVLRETEI